MHSTRWKVYNVTHSSQVALNKLVMKHKVGWVRCERGARLRNDSHHGPYFVIQRLRHGSAFLISETISCCFNDQRLPR